MAAEQVEVNPGSGPDRCTERRRWQDWRPLAPGMASFARVRAVTLPNNGQQRMRYEQTWQGSRSGARFWWPISRWGQVNQVSGTMLRKIDADLTGPAVALCQRRRTPGSQRCQGKRTGQAVRDAG